MIGVGFGIVDTRPRMTTVDDGSDPDTDGINNGRVCLIQLAGDQGVIAVNAIIPIDDGILNRTQPLAQPQSRIQTVGVQGLVCLV